jgi:hypothetical protein
MPQRLGPPEPGSPTRGRARRVASVGVTIPDSSRHGPAPSRPYCESGHYHLIVLTASLNVASDVIRTRAYGHTNSRTQIARRGIRAGPACEKCMDQRLGILFQSLTPTRARLFHRQPLGVQGDRGRRATLSIGIDGVNSAVRGSKTARGDSWSRRSSGTRRPFRRGHRKPMSRPSSHRPARYGPAFGTSGSLACLITTADSDRQRIGREKADPRARPQGHTKHWSTRRDARAASHAEAASANWVNHLGQQHVVAPVKFAG